MPSAASAQAPSTNNLGVDGKLAADHLGQTLDVSPDAYTKSGIARQAEAISELDTALSPRMRLRQAPYPSLATTVSFGFK